MKMFRRGGQCAFSKTEATPHGLLGCSSVGQPCTEQRAVPPDDNSPQSLPQPLHPSVLWQRSPSRAAGSSRARGARDAAEAAPARPPAALGAFKEGVGRPEAANQLGTTSEYADGHPGGQVQPRRPATFPAVSHTYSPWSQTDKGYQVPSCWLPKWAEAQKSNFPLEFGLEAPFRTQDGELLVRRWKHIKPTSSATAKEGGGPDPTSYPSSTESARAFPTSHTMGAQRHFGWPGGLQYRTWPRNGATREKQQHRVSCLSQGALEAAPADLASVPAEHILTPAPGQTYLPQQHMWLSDTSPHAGAVDRWAKSSHACCSWGFICFASTCLLSMAMFSVFIV